MGKNITADIIFTTSEVLMSISLKVRFEVFKRDSFTCRYCGKKPPEVTLEVDHIIPVFEGGKDDINNLITSCFNCNRGKGKTPLDILPNSISDNLSIIKEQQKQTKQYYKYLGEIAQQKESDIKEIGIYFFDKFAKSKRTKGRFIFTPGGREYSGIKQFLKVFTKYEIMEAIDISFGKLGFYCDDAKVFKYTCGILHNWRKSRHGENPLS